MAITSTEIHEQSFSIDRKGYDVDEVDVFLEHVADEIDGLNATIADLEDQIDNMPELQDDFSGFDTPIAVADEPQVDTALLAEKDAEIADLKQQLAERQADGSAIAQALIIAQRSADDTIAAAKAEAARIVKRAEEEADRILAEADGERQAVLDEIKQLEDDCDATRTEYQTVLKDFINDATTKLHALGESAFAGAHATGYNPQDFMSPAEIESDMAPVQPAPRAQVDAASYVVPQPAAVVGAAATVTPSVVEKDFSGFGDADDSFQFDELD